MNTLQESHFSLLLEKLHCEAAAADRTLFEGLPEQNGTIQDSMADTAAELIERERVDYRAVYGDFAANFLCVSRRYGRMLYAMARATRATRIVEFGTSMGVSALYLAAALRDNGGGLLIGSELEPGKVARARATIETAGLSDLVEIREGDALHSLRDVRERIDLVHLDGAWSLYLPVLALLEPRLRPGSIILGENAFADDYLDYVRDPTNGYISQPVPIDEGRGNEFTVKVGQSG